MKKVLKKWARTGTETRDDIYDKLGSASGGARRIAKKVVEKVKPDPTRYKPRKRKMNSREKEELGLVGAGLAAGTTALGAQLYVHSEKVDRERAAHKKRKKEEKEYREKRKKENRGKRKARNKTIGDDKTSISPYLYGDMLEEKK
jgi:hypothetical protein